MACVNMKCRDPCPGTCAQLAICEVFNHIAMCSCPTGMEGNAFVQCQQIQSKLPAHSNNILRTQLPYMFTVIQIENPCHPSPCGPNSQCRPVNGQSVCSCIPGYIGSPPMCRPECVQSNECSLSQACLNQKCVDPCIGTCGIGAVCKVINHSPICRCPDRYDGNPFRSCQPIGMTRNSCAADRR